MKLIGIEFKKLKNSKIFLPLLFIPLISVIYGSMNYYLNTNMLKKEWISLWTQVYLFYGLFFLPAIIGIIGSYLWAGEHKNNNMNLILGASYSFKQIIIAKTFVGFILLLFTQFYLGILFTIAGGVFNFASSYPVGLIKYLFLASLLSFSLISLQSYLSFRIKSFAPPVAIGILFSIASLIISGNQIIPQVKYLLSNSAITIAMNHYPDMEISGREQIIMLIISILVSFIFIVLQENELKKRLD